MKNLIRAFVLVLTVAGSVAYTQINASTANKTVLSKVNSIPTPMCPMNDPNACGMRWREVVTKGR